MLGFFPITSNFPVQNIRTIASNNEFGVKFDYKLGEDHACAVRYLLGDSLQSGPPFAELQAGGGIQSGPFILGPPRTALNVYRKMTLARRIIPG